MDHANDSERVSPSEKGALHKYCPFAEIVKPSMKTQGKYPKGYPEGAVVHFTAGSSAESSLGWGRESGYCFFVIKKDGAILQSFPLDEWGSHAGSSTWGGRTGVSRYFVGIEIDCAGELHKKEDGELYSWFNKKIPAEKARIIEKKKDNAQVGTYEAYTKEQEESLVSLLLWLHNNGPEVFKIDNVVGHDEVAPGRKTDPGGALSMTMPELRKLLQGKVQNG